jgi:hypothetical protein
VHPSRGLTPPLFTRQQCEVFHGSALDDNWFYIDPNASERRPGLRSTGLLTSLTHIHDGRERGLREKRHRCDQRKRDSKDSAHAISSSFRGSSLGEEIGGAKKN